MLIDEPNRPKLRTLQLLPTLPKSRHDSAEPSFRMP
jgi:hypothetical protein